MFNLGDELTIDNYRIIPWLMIWIQLLVMFLLILLLLYGFTFFTQDDHIHSSHYPTTATGSSSSSSAPAAAPSSGCRSLIISSSFHNSSKVIRQNQRIQRETGTSTSGGMVKSTDDIQDIVGCPTKDAAEFSHFRYSHHPCDFLGLAKQAFLKCLGLDSTPDNPCRKRRKDKKH